MEKFEKYNPDEETIEAWLKIFEIRLLCHNITAADRKRYWFRSLVGEAGNLIIEKLPLATTWPEIKEELCSVLGENDPKGRGFENLLSYKPKGKDLVEMATDIMAKAAICHLRYRPADTAWAQGISPGCAQKHWPGAASHAF